MHTRTPFIRLVVDHAGAGPFHMAADRFAMRRSVEEDCFILRLYTWTPPCISLGYMENIDQVVDMDRLFSQGYQWVQRITGGRSVLHANDLTYSCAFPARWESLGRSIKSSYRMLCTCLRTGLAHCGISATSHDSDLSGRAARALIKTPCFIAPNREEIMVNGRKLIGSAQKRTAEAVLQHGSLPLDMSFADLPLFLRVDDAQKRSLQELLQEKCTCLQNVAPRVSLNEIMDGMAEGFRQTLSLPIVKKEWSRNEKNDITRGITGTINTGKCGVTP